MSEEEKQFGASNKYAFITIGNLRLKLHSKNASQFSLSKLEKVKKNKPPGVNSKTQVDFLGCEVPEGGHVRLQAISGQVMNSLDSYDPS